MKMAKASEADIDMAIDVAHVLEDIDRGIFPTKFGDPDSEETEWLNTDSYEQYERLIDGLERMLARGSVFRVVFGMAVVCDPINELLDPEADTIEHHPIRQKLEAEREELLEALQSCMNLIELISPVEGEVTRKARAAIAKATGGAA